MKIYTMRDRKSNLFANPFVSHNDKTAVREFDYICNRPENAHMAEDVELYSIGDFNVDTGEITAYKPEFIKNGEYRGVVVDE